MNFVLPFCLANGMYQLVIFSYSEVLAWALDFCRPLLTAVLSLRESRLEESATPEQKHCS